MVTNPLDPGGSGYTPQGGWQSYAPGYTPSNVQSYQAPTSGPQASQLSAGEMSNLSTYGTTTPSWAKKFKTVIKKIVRQPAKISKAFISQELSPSLVKFKDKYRATLQPTSSLSQLDKNIIQKKAQTQDAMSRFRDSATQRAIRDETRFGTLSKIKIEDIPTEPELSSGAQAPTYTIPQDLRSKEKVRKEQIESRITELVGPLGGRREQETHLLEKGKTELSKLRQEQTYLQSIDPTQRLAVTDIGVQETRLLSPLEEFQEKTRTRSQGFQYTPPEQGEPLSFQEQRAGLIEGGKTDKIIFLPGGAGAEQPKVVSAYGPPQFQYELQSFLPSRLSGPEALARREVLNILYPYRPFKDPLDIMAMDTRSTEQKALDKRVAETMRQRRSFIESKPTFIEEIFGARTSIVKGLRQDLAKEKPSYYDWLRPIWRKTVLEPKAKASLLWGNVVTPTTRTSWHGIADTPRRYTPEGINAVDFWIRRGKETLAQWNIEKGKVAKELGVSAGVGFVFFKVTTALKKGPVPLKIAAFTAEAAALGVYGTKVGMDLWTRKKQTDLWDPGVLYEEVPGLVGFGLGAKGATATTKSPLLGSLFRDRIATVSLVKKPPGGGGKLEKTKSFILKTEVGDKGKAVKSGDSILEQTYDFDALKLTTRTYVLKPKKGTRKFIESLAGKKRKFTKVLVKTKTEKIAGDLTPANLKAKFDKSYPTKRISTTQLGIEQRFDYPLSEGRRGALQGYIRGRTKETFRATAGAWTDKLFYRKPKDLREGMLGLERGDTRGDVFDIKQSKKNWQQLTMSSSIKEPYGYVLARKRGITKPTRLKPEDYWKTTPAREMVGSYIGKTLKPRKVGESTAFISYKSPASYLTGMIKGRRRMTWAESYAKGLEGKSLASLSYKRPPLKRGSTKGLWPYSDIIRQTPEGPIFRFFKKPAFFGKKSASKDVGLSRPIYLKSSKKILPKETLRIKTTDKYSIATLRREPVVEFAQVPDIKNVLRTTKLGRDAFIVTKIKGPKETYRGSKWADARLKGTQDIGGQVFLKTSGIKGYFRSPNFFPQLGVREGAIKFKTGGLIRKRKGLAIYNLGRKGKYDVSPIELMTGKITLRREGRQNILKGLEVTKKIFEPITQEPKGPLFMITSPLQALALRLKPAIQKVATPTPIKIQSPQKLGTDFLPQLELKLSQPGPSFSPFRLLPSLKSVPQSALIPTSRITSKSRIRSRLEIGSRFKIDTKPIMEQKADIFSTLKFRHKIKSKIKGRTKSKIKGRTKSKTNIKMDIFIKQMPKMELRLKQQMRLRTRTRTKLRTKVRTKVKVTKTKIKVPKLKVPFPILMGTGKYGKKVKPQQLFRLFIRRGGKWLRVGGLLPKGKALQRGAAEVKGTLAASFKLMTAKGAKGKKQMKDINYTISPLVFRAPKREAGRIFIQRGGKEPTFISGARLASPGERKEFKMLRGKSVKFI